MRHLKLTKKTRHLALAVSAMATVVCLSIGLSSNNHNTSDNQSRYQLEILLFCAGLTSAITFELLGQRLSGPSLGQYFSSNRSPLSKISFPKSQLPSSKNSAQKSRRSRSIPYFSRLFLIGGMLLAVPLFSKYYLFGFANSVLHHTVENQPTIKNSPEFLEAQVLDDTPLHLEAAKAAIEEGDYQKALRLYEKVIELDNQNLEALTQRCSILSDLGRSGPSISACEELNMVIPNDVVALSRLGKAYQEIGQHRLALEYYQKALHIDPDHHAAQQGKAELDQFIGQPQ